MKNHNAIQRGQAHIIHYQARTLRPITAHPVNGDGPPRVIPGGALVTVTENTDHTPGQTVHTATAHMGGEWFEAIVQPEQFTHYSQ